MRCILGYFLNPFSQNVIDCARRIAWAPLIMPNYEEGDRHGDKTHVSSLSEPIHVIIRLLLSARDVFLLCKDQEMLQLLYEYKRSIELQAKVVIHFKMDTEKPVSSEAILTYNVTNKCQGRIYISTKSLLMFCSFSCDACARKQRYFGSCSRRSATSRKKTYKVQGDHRSAHIANKSTTLCISCAWGCPKSNLESLIETQERVYCIGKES